MNDLYQGRYHMADNARRHGPLWIHLSESELVWSLAAAVSVGLLLGLTIAFMSMSGGNAP